MNWFTLFCGVLSCSEGFGKRAEAQLRRQFLDRTGLPLKGFVLLPPGTGDAAISVDGEGAALLDTWLAGPDARSFEVSLGWRCPGGTPPLPSDPQPCDGLEFWWRTLPTDRLRAHYAKPAEPPWPTSGDFPFVPERYSFNVDWDRFAWPDLRLQVATDRTVEPAMLDFLVTALEETRLAWNTAAEAGAASGRIHNLGSLAKLVGRKAMLVDVDFGSAGPKSLIVMLDTLQTLAGKFGIRRVRIGGS